MSDQAERRPVWLPLLAYVALIAILALTHDMWRDEVRAFSVATRASSWPQMLSDLHEEGHPAVWYSILRAGYAVTHSPLVMPVAAALIAIASAYLLLRLSPFSLWPRLLTLFGAFLGYELSVVARNYGIGVLFMITACVYFRRRAERPWPLALALALLANTSVHGAVASALLLLLWASDSFDAERRAQSFQPASLLAAALVLAGIGFALATAWPPADMAYAFRSSRLDPSAIAHAIFVDPGYGLRGSGGANILAAGEIPWEKLGLDRLLVSRMLVDAALLSLAWGLRRNARVLSVLVAAILGFEILFSVVYPGGLRHEALLGFLIISLCWIAIADTRETDRASARRRITLGLLPLLAVQTAALPFMVRRHIEKPESMGRTLASVIAKRPGFSNAILMSEPDPMMETMPYYVSNPVFMPRQREFDYRAYFENGTKRQKLLTLSGLVAIADSLGCATRRPILLSIGHRQFFLAEQGEKVGPYKSVFRWSADEMVRFRERAKPLPWFPGALSDENYRTYELRPLESEACK